MWKKFCRARPQPTSQVGRPNVNGPLRHAASDSIAVKPSLLMEGRGRSAVDIVIVAPGISRAVDGRVLGNRSVEGRRN